MPIIDKNYQQESVKREGSINSELQGTEKKTLLRKEMRKKRDALSAAKIRELSLGCMEQLFTLPAFSDSVWIYTYLAIGSEVDTLFMIKEFVNRGKRVAVPKVEGEEIVFYEITSVKDCCPGCYGILEPVPYKEPVAEPGLILLPGLAFDERGARLGYGGGYYDRFLHAHPDYPTAALAYEMQILREVPAEPHDCRVNVVVTPERLICAR